MAFMGKVFDGYDISCLIVGFCCFKTIVSLSLCNNRWKEILYDERSITLFKNYIRNTFNFNDERELIESGKQNFFIRNGNPYDINSSLSNKIYNEALNAKKGYGIFLNFYSELHKIISKIRNVYGI